MYSRTQKKHWLSRLQMGSESDTSVHDTFNMAQAVEA